MKRILHILIVFVLVTSTSHASGNIGLHLFGGVAFPSGHLGDLYETGFGLGAAVEYRLNPSWSILASMGYARWSDSYDITEFNITETYETSLYTIPVQGGLRYYLFEEGISIYVEAETGMYFVTWDETFVGDTEGSTGNDVGFGFGGGVLVFLTPSFQIDARLKYNLINTAADSLTYFSILTGIRFVL